MIRSNVIKEGDRILARQKTIFTFGDFCYPWDDRYVPIHVEKEYKKFFVCTVEEHEYKKGNVFYKSSPYRLTLDKFDIDIGNIIVKQIL